MMSHPRTKQAVCGEPAQAFYCSGFRQAVIFVTTDVLFLTVYHNLPGVSEGEEIKYYAPSNFESLRTDLASTVEHHFSLFSRSVYGDYFWCAGYEIHEMLDDAEVVIFRSALDAKERKISLSDLHPYDTFCGSRAVVSSHVKEADLDRNKRAIELFNLVMESALPTDGREDPRCCILLQTASEFAPSFINDMLDTVRSDSNPWSFRNRHRESLKPLQPLLEMLAWEVDHTVWPRNELALGRFLLIIDYYKKLEDQWQGNFDP